FTYLDVFRVHTVLGDVGHAYWLEGTGAHVQGHGGAGDALLEQGLEQRRIEVQACGGRGHGTGPACVYRPATVAGLLLVLPFDVGRQWHVAYAVEEPYQVQAFGEGEHAKAILLTHDRRFHFRAIRIRNDKACTRHQAPRGTQLCQQAIAGQHTFHKQFQPATRRLARKDTRRDDASIIEDQQIFRFQQRRQLVETEVAEAAIVSAKLQQATAAALGQRVAGDLAFGQIEVEILELHERLW